MKDRQRRWARLLPDHRTLYVSLDELDAHREPGESDAHLIVRSVHFAQRVSHDDHGVRTLARELMARTGLPEKDPLGLELAMAMVVRARFLSEHPHVLYVTVDEESSPGPWEGE